jgi:hypothetical protein
MTTLIPKYDQGNTNAVNRAINLKLQETVSVQDFGADATGVSDSTSAFTAAIATGKVVNIPNGTYKINSPIALEASPAASLSLIGQSPNHTSVTGSGQVVIDLSSNTTYFCALGYSPYIKGICFKGGVDVFHYSTQGIDAGPCEFTNISAFGWTGKFFKAFGSGNGTHITWNNPLLLSNNTSCQIYDDVTAFGNQGFDALTINDGYIETAGSLNFYICTGRITVNNTRFVPYTNAGSLWFNVFGASHFSAFNTDFGGESERKFMQWNYAGGDIALYSSSINTNQSGSILLNAPPNRITFVDCEGWGTPYGYSAIAIPNSLSATNQALLQNTQLSINGSSQSLLSTLASNDSLPAWWGVIPQWLNQEVEGIVRNGDILAIAGSSYLGANGSTNATGLSSPTDILGNSSQVIGWQATGVGDFTAYQYFSSAPGQTSIPVGEATLEAFVCITGNTARCDLFFGNNGSGASLTKTFWLGPGNHRICFPLMITSSMTGSNMQIGVQCSGQYGSTIMFSRVRVFAGMYHHRCDDFYATTANTPPSSSTYLWFKGDRIINAPASVGNPKAWTCTVSGAPGTWTSEGNL